jgi:hypothetical protein
LEHTQEQRFRAISFYVKEKKVLGDFCKGEPVAHLQRTLREYAGIFAKGKKTLKIFFFCFFCLTSKGKLFLAEFFVG